MQEQPMVDETLDAPFTPLDEEAARVLAARLYGLDVREARRFDTERDDTFRLTAGDARFVLKVANPADDPALVAMQCEALAHVAAVDPQVPVPRVVPDLSGAAHSVVEGADGEPRTVRLLTFLPGRTLDYAATTAAQRASLGRTVGRLSAALAGFEHPAADRVLAWDLQHVGGLRPQLEHVVDPRTRDDVAAELDRFDAVTAPGLAAVRHQVVHNDVNVDNVVVDEAGDVAGILDFGDMVRTAVVADRAVAMSYAVGADGSVADGALDPWAAPYDLARGFADVRPLEPDELALLPHLVRARLAQRLLVNSWLAASNPDNAHYTARSVATATLALRRLAAAEPPAPEGAPR
ncbi:MAG: phosphotransferase [Candidatus Nanopelagicales bacterium]